MLVAILFLAAAEPAGTVHVAPLSLAPAFEEMLEEKAQSCGLDSLQWSSKTVKTEPATEAERQALDLSVRQVLESAGLPTDPKEGPVSYEVARNLMTTRLLLRISESASPEDQPDAEGLNCVSDWLRSQGFTEPTAAEAAAFRGTKSN